MATKPNTGPGPNPRIKDMDKESYAYYNTLSQNTKGFIDEYYEKTGRTFNITSGARPKGKTTSHHHIGDAFDVKAIHTVDYDYLLNTKEGLGLLNKYGLGVIDETDPVMMEKTGATGPHFHIGKDSKWTSKVKERYDNFDVAPKVVAYNEWVNTGNNPGDFTPFLELEGHKGHTDEAAQKAYVPYKDYVGATIDTRVAEKEIIKTVKEEQDDDRKALADATKAENEYKASILSQYQNHLSTVNNDPLQKYQDQGNRTVQLPNPEFQLQDYNLNIFNAG